MKFALPSVKTLLDPIAVLLFTAIATTALGQSTGTLSGTVTDRIGAAILGAEVRLVDENPSLPRKTRTETDGAFYLTGVAPGEFRLSISATGFETSTVSGIMRPAESLTLPEISLAIAHSATEIVVRPPDAEIATEQLHAEEQQRLLGVIPNFSVSYEPKAIPLSTRQKFQLASKFTLDPASFAIAGTIAGSQQANNSISGYGQGAQGYFKRYGAAYGNFLTGTLLSSAVLPSVLKQDPRYFYKGTGTRKSRLLYAIANAVVCKGDNQRWQPNYSGIGGTLAAGGLSNLYYPAKNRNGVALTFENGAIGIAASAAGNVVQEFLFRKLTPHKNP